MKGIHLHETLKNPDQFRRVNWDLVLLLSTDLHLLSLVRELAPQAKITVRFYHPDVMSTTPEDAADFFCGLLSHYCGDQPINAICMNEPDQAIEHGGREYTEARWGQIVKWSDPRGLEIIADWASRYADAHRAIRPQDILHLPACSAGMNRLWYWEAMPVDKFDVVDIHWYELGAVPGEVAQRSVWGKPVAITEWGKIGGTPEEYAAFALSLGDTMNCIWKWSEPNRDSNPEGDPAGYAIADRPDVIEALAIESHIVRPDDPLPKSNAVIYEDELKEWPENEDTKEDKVPDIIDEVMDPLYNTWVEEYRTAHNGMYPDDWEFRKHRLAIDANLWVTQADLDAVNEDLRAAIRQSEMLKARLGGGSAPAPFQPVIIRELTDNHGGTREETDLIIIHSTRSGKKRTAEQELASTRSWFANPNSKASAQAVIAANGDIYLFVPAEYASWGATYLNERAINIELVQPTIEIPFTDEQYTSLAWLLKEWTGLFGVPYVRVMDENERGIIGHEDSAQGQSYGKSDPGYMLDWSRIGL